MSYFGRYQGNAFGSWWGTVGAIASAIARAPTLFIANVGRLMNRR